MNTEQLQWFKSSHSGGEGGTCMEVAYSWRKSSHGDGEGGACVEVAAGHITVHVRDSKNPAGPQLACPPASWASFVSYARGRITQG
ncbi:DUF397 domain-containing protein [Streptomyces wuyuanensis]|uniref:DUF397 domain-containing protein n=1 Tax=Streptomyces wuyuanensis TaxID=1196353 RepID=UPI0037877D08